MGARRFLEDIREAVAGRLHFALYPVGVSALNLILPFDVVPGMNSDLKTFVTNPRQDVGATPADIGTGQQRAVQQCGKTIVGDNGSARDLFQEARSEDALDGAPCV